MCKTKKIIAGFLCAMAAGVGILSIMPQTAGAQTAASQGATATAGMSLEQLQQIIEMLKQQIQQIIVLLQQRIQLRQDCVGEGQTFTDANRQCCAGLEKQDIGTPCPDGQVCAQVISYKCVKPATLTCAEVCRAQGYADSKCSTYAVSPEGFANKCGAGNYILSGQSASDCQLETNSAGVPVVGAGKACCCAAQVSTCAGEGEKIYMSSLADGRPTQCCSGLTAISSCSAGGLCPNDGSSTCAYCGDGVCGLGENKVNCLKDCGEGKTKCIATGGSWVWSVCAKNVCSVPDTKNDRLNSSGMSCNDVCKSGYDCVCPAGKYWASREEGCIAKETTCAGEGETIYTYGKKCCAGLTAVGECSSTANCDADSWVCKKVVSTCAKEGETFTDDNRQCCAGLEKQDIGTPCPDGQVCAQVISYKCGKPATLTCAEACKAKGYTNSTCAAWGITQYSTVGGCSAGQTNIGWTSDCTAAQLAGGGRACCCYNQTPTCAKEGESVPVVPGAPSCCAGLAQISCDRPDSSGNCQYGCAGGSICANCGNGVCGEGENKCNCPKDCSPVVCSSTLSADQCKLAGGAYACPEDYSSTDSYIGSNISRSGSSWVYVKSNCYCSCPLSNTIPADTTVISGSAASYYSTGN